MPVAPDRLMPMRTVSVIVLVAVAVVVVDVR